MPANRKRYRAYADDLQALIASLSTPERLRTLEAKVLDLLQRRGITFTDFDGGEALRLTRTLRELLGRELAPFADELLHSYRSTLEVVNEHYSDLGTDARPEMAQVRALEEASRQELGRYRESTVQSIERAVREGARQGETWRELADRIRPASKKAAFYAETLAKTQIKAVGRTAKTEKARQAQAFMMEYVGVVRSTTRPFCHAHVGQTLHLDDIRRLRNGNREPVITYCGGWNCIHDWEPDPFAGTSRTTELREINDGGRVVRLAGGDAAVREYGRAKGANARARQAK